MKLRSCILGACCSLLLLFAAQAQQAPPASESSESNEIGGMTLQLGMERRLSKNSAVCTATSSGLMASLQNIGYATYDL
jgi:hypothetical protein